MKYLLTISLALLSVVSFAQNAPAKTGGSGGDCFKEWYTLFKERGAGPVADGTHDVVITYRNGNISECYMGRVDVANGKISSKPLVQQVDGTYEEWDKKVSSSYLNSEGKLSEELRDVTNGMSASITLADGEMVRLFFFRSVLPKPKAKKKAPAPSALVK